VHDDKIQVSNAFCTAFRCFKLVLFLVLKTLGQCGIVQSILHEHNVCQKWHRSMYAAQTSKNTVSTVHFHYCLCDIYHCLLPQGWSFACLPMGLRSQQSGYCDL